MLALDMPKGFQTSCIAKNKDEYEDREKGVLCTCLVLCIYKGQDCSMPAVKTARGTAKGTASRTYLLSARQPSSPRRNDELLSQSLT